MPSNVDFDRIKHLVLSLTITCAILTAACMQIIGMAIFEFVLVSGMIMLTVSNLVKAQGANVRRYISVFTGVALAGLIIYFSLANDNSLGAGLVDIVLLMFANVTLAIVIVQVCLYGAPYQRWSITTVDAGCASIPFH